MTVLGFLVIASKMVQVGFVFLYNKTMCVHFSVADARMQHYCWWMTVISDKDARMRHYEKALTLQGMKRRIIELKENCCPELQKSKGRDFRRRP